MIMKLIGGEGGKPHLFKQMLTTILRRKNSIHTNTIEEIYLVLL